MHPLHFCRQTSQTAYPNSNSLCWRPQQASAIGVRLVKCMIQLWCRYVMHIYSGLRSKSKCTAWSGLHTNSGKSGFGSGGLQVVDFLNLWAYLAVHFALTPDNSDRSWIETCGITFERNGNNTPAVIIVFIDQDETTNFQQERWRV